MSSPPTAPSLSNRFKHMVALFITHHCVKAFVQAQSAPTAEEIAHELEIPIRLVRSILLELTEARISCRRFVASDSETVAYQPGCPLDQLTVTKALGRDGPPW